MFSYRMGLLFALILISSSEIFTAAHSDGTASLRQLVRKCSIKAFLEEAISSSTISQYLAMQSYGIEVSNVRNSRV